MSKPEQSQTFSNDKSTMAKKSKMAQTKPLLEGQQHMKKINSPILNIYVGPEARLLQVHKSVLVDTTENFRKMFNRSGSSAYLTEDDEGAWKELIAWCYYPNTIAHPRVVEDNRLIYVNTCKTSEILNRMKLCVLARKYNVLLLHNLAIDGLVELLYQKRDATEPKFQWKTFQMYFRYAFANRVEGDRPTSLQCVLANYFRYIFCHEHKLYDPDKMKALAKELPRLSNMSLIPATNDIAPWEIDPCHFHIHLPDENPLSCPRRCLKDGGFEFPHHTAQIYYVLQSEHLLYGSTEFSVPALASRASLGQGEECIARGVTRLAREDRLRWVERGLLFRLVGEEEEIDSEDSNKGSPDSESDEGGSDECGGGDESDEGINDENDEGESEEDASEYEDEDYEGDKE